MLKISDQQLKQEAKSRGYRPEMVEKVYHLLELLEEFMAVPYLSDRLALKGGTAINLFCTDQFPRLSVDLDFNYIGAVNRDIMLKEKPELESILLLVQVLLCLPCFHPPYLLIRFLPFIPSCLRRNGQLK